MEVNGEMESCIWSMYNTFLSKHRGCSHVLKKKKKKNEIKKTVYCNHGSVLRNDGCNVRADQMISFNILAFGGFLLNIICVFVCNVAHNYDKH